MNESAEQFLEQPVSIERADTPDVPRSAPHPAIELLFCLALFAFVILSRAFTSGPVYYVDGPLHLKAIADGSYVIQPPR